MRSYLMQTPIHGFLLSASLFSLGVLDFFKLTAGLWLVLETLFPGSCQTEGDVRKAPPFLHSAVLRPTHLISRPGWIAALCFISTSAKPPNLDPEAAHCKCATAYGALFVFTSFFGVFLGFPTFGLHFLSL
ncbi:hypothetical protein B0H67DRAFT_309894 [Lasiosphaeris hirsuta]|uniref:Uncharacterized protein n=1 Tax=Lasiosphaeris hirsuta TaxID=260670 RepID=A0AA40A165_9PEZI|nr:hypothetical protein B0H67DRAFT_309894 [Lasiosphaeris hirsuta]